MNNSTITNVIMGVLMALALGLGGWALSTTQSLQIQMAVLQQQLKDNDTHDKAITKHWKLHTWAREEINDLRIADGLPQARWPDLGE